MRRRGTESSDVDLVILAEEPRKYLHDASWLLKFGGASRQQTEPYGDLTSIRAWYADGLEVEYGITGKYWAELPLDDGTRRVV